MKKQKTEISYGGAALVVASIFAIIFFCWQLIDTFMRFDLSTASQTAKDMYIGLMWFQRQSAFALDAIGILVSIALMVYGLHLRVPARDKKKTEAPKTEVSVHRESENEEEDEYI